MCLVGLIGFLCYTLLVSGYSRVLHLINSRLRLRIFLLGRCAARAHVDYAREMVVSMCAQIFLWKTVVSHRHGIPDVCRCLAPPLPTELCSSLRHLYNDWSLGSRTTFGVRCLSCQDAISNGFSSISPTLRCSRNSLLRPLGLAHSHKHLCARWAVCGIASGAVGHLDGDGSALHAAIFR